MLGGGQNSLPGETVLEGESLPDACTGHLEDGSVLALHSLQESWLRELELQVQVGQLIVAPCLGLLLDELGQVAPVLGQTQVLVVDDACRRGC